MKLNVHVLDKHVGVLEQVGDFRSVMAYVPDTALNNLVSLTMPVRTESYIWDDEIHPIFRMNLPEGYLLQVLQEEFGPHIGANPVALLSVVGRNMVGRLKVAPPGAALDESAHPVEVAELLKGDNSEEAFSQLVREHARSGVSGILPKFLDVEKKKQPGMGRHPEATLLTHRHIIKGSSLRLPHALRMSTCACRLRHACWPRPPRNYQRMATFSWYIASMWTKRGNRSVLSRTFARCLDCGPHRNTTPHGRDSRRLFGRMCRDETITQLS